MTHIDALDPHDLLLRRTSSQLLDRRIAGPPEAAVGALLAVQAQNRSSWRLALRARVAGITAADVDRALSDDRSLLVAWLNRGTLHLVRSEDYPWLLALTAPTQVVANARRLDQEGLTPEEADRGVACIDESLIAEGPLVRGHLRERLAARGIRTEGQALVHLLFAAVIRGVAVLGPMAPGGHAFVHAREWLGSAAEPLRPGWRDAALAELARRYLTGHGPATAQDLGKWAGLPLRDTRAGLRSIGSELVELPGGLLDLGSRWPSGEAAKFDGRPTRREPSPGIGRREEPLSPRLLPDFDPCLLGWREREPFLRREDEPLVIPPGGGLFRPVATVDGVAAGTWSVRRVGDRIAVTVAPFRPLSLDAMAALRAEAKDVARFEGRALTGVDGLP
jgi:hypothetical protein